METILTEILVRRNGEPVDGVHVHLVLIDQYFFGDRTQFRGTTGLDGRWIAKDIPPGTYLVVIQSEKLVIEEIIELDESLTITFPLPRFSFKKKEKLVPKEDIQRVYSDVIALQGSY